MLRTSAKYLLIILLVMIILLTAGVVLLQTALFHINPIKIGYNRFDHSNCVIYSKAGSVEAEYEELKAAMIQNEAVHGLQYKARIQLILCGSQKEINKYLPFVNRVDRKNAGGFAPWPNTIYITPKIKEKYGSLRGVLVHELSHILLLQNFGILKCYRLWSRSEWIPEGFAVFVANWPVYFTKERLQAYAANAGIDMSNGQLLGTEHSQKVPLPIRFMIYYYFIDYLYQRNDEATLVRFLQVACDNPRRVEDTFKESFRSSFSESVRAFASSITEK